MVSRKSTRIDAIQSWPVCVATAVLFAIGIFSVHEVRSGEETAGKPTQAADDASGDERPIDRSRLAELLERKEYEKAIEQVDKLAAASPDHAALPAMESLLASALLRSPKASEGRERLRRMFDRFVAAESLTSGEIGGLISTTSMMTQLDRSLGEDEKFAMIDQALDRLKKLDSVSAGYGIRTLQTLKARLLVSAKRFDEAKPLFDQLLTQSRETLKKGTKISIGEHLSTASMYLVSFRKKYPEDAQSVFLEANAAAESLLERNDLKAIDIAPYVSFKSVAANAFVEDDVELAKVAIDELSDALRRLAIKLGPEEGKKLETYQKSIVSTRARIESALIHHRLIGTDAPEIEGEHFVAMEPATMKSLRGKVVLIDFWAVWCGPCIATFPHLIEWHEKYAEQGLIILGATQLFGYRWDEEAQRAVRSSPEESPTTEEELAMLERFREKHELHHGFFVTPKGSSYQKEYGVYGIPQAVLVDRQGKVQLIRTGSGDSNAKALEEKIRELLDR